jgi:OmpA-OmpF porin, OOP family
MTHLRRLRLPLRARPAAGARDVRGPWRLPLPPGARETEAGDSFAAVVTSRGRGAGYVHVTASRPRRRPARRRPAEAAACPAPLPDRPRRPAGAAELLTAEGTRCSTVSPSPPARRRWPRPSTTACAPRALPRRQSARCRGARGPHGCGRVARRQHPAVARPGRGGARAADLGHMARTGAAEALGAGYLAPLASNLTPEGRDANRRVEAVLLSNE